MSKKYLSLMLIGLLLNLVFYSPTWAKDIEKEARNAAKVKNEIARLGSGQQSIIKVKLRDKSKVEGYISAIGENSFTIIDKQTNQPVEVQYSNVKKAAGKNYSTGQKVLIGIGIAVFIIMIVAIAVSDTGV